MRTVFEENNDILDLNSVIELSHDMEYYPLTENQMGIYYECMQTSELLLMRGGKGDAA